MKFVPVNELPKKKAARHKLQDLIKEFCDDDYKIVKIDLDKHDYKSPKVCCGAMHVAVKRSKRPVKVAIRGDDVYLIKL